MTSKRFKKIAFTVLIVYLIVLFRITVFRSRSYPTDFAVNLSLFTDLVATYHENGLWMMLYLLVGNIVWFVPFGFLVTGIWQRLKIWTVVPVGFLLSLTIEICQLVTGKGMFEIDDLVLNTLGTAIGCLIYKTYRSFKK